MPSAATPDDVRLMVVDRCVHLIVEKLVVGWAAVVSDVGCLVAVPPAMQADKSVDDEVFNILSSSKWEIERFPQVWKVRRCTPQQ